MTESAQWAGLVKICCGTVPLSVLKTRKLNKASNANTPQFKQQIHQSQGTNTTQLSAATISNSTVEDGQHAGSLGPPQHQALLPQPDALERRVRRLLLNSTGL